ncbi:MAG: ribonuclease P protein component [Prevotellaceae bacterium]|nr:ribonuclease P protein component [Prevotellaceae bacterium]
MAYTLHKSERLHKRSLIEKMFTGGSRSFSLFPLRVVYYPCDAPGGNVAILVSVSKRRFKHAVDRNLLKRRIREAYRLQKQPLLDALACKQCSMAIAFIYLSPKLEPYRLIQTRMKTALARIAEKAAEKPRPATTTEA